MAVQMHMETAEGLKIPSLGFGTWQCTDEDELEAALNAALETGYRHVDTAYFFGNEHVVGRVINEWIESERLAREDVFLSTKLPIFGFHEDLVEEYMLKSLENLGVERVDLYFAHFPLHMNYDEGLDDPTFMETDHMAVWKKMEEQVEQGRATAIGLSNFNMTQTERIVEEAAIKPACLQVENHIYLQQRDLVQFCHDNGIVVIGFSPLGSPDVNSFYESIGRPTRDLPDLFQDPTVLSLAEKYGKTAAQILLRFQLQRDVAVVVKSKTPSRIEENFEVFDFCIGDEDMEELRALDVGEAARIVDFSVLSQKLLEQPEWPWHTFTKVSE
ncbi:unnamed protein product [Phyllotreta striolata]|uniref:NADP-dependent oxidoreductase domain-containing protein n=1 Tax=Phyllotreta striolata TaxID=444603 RepID=A0A9N9TWU2_PHYSR|nr:unnamed protein product [Phyllotreta striolata]